MANPVNPLNPPWSASITASVESTNILETSPNQLEMENTPLIFSLQHGPLIGVGLPLSRLVYPGPQILHGLHQSPQIGPGLLNQQMVEITPGPQPGHGPPLIGLGLLLSRLVFPGPQTLHGLHPNQQIGLGLRNQQGSQSQLEMENTPGPLIGLGPHPSPRIGLGPQTLHGLHQSRLIGPGLLNQQGSQSLPTANPANPATPPDPQTLLIQELRNPGCVSVGWSHNLE